MTICQGQFVILDSTNPVQRLIIKEKLAHAKTVDKDITLSTEKDKDVHCILLKVRKRVFLDCTVQTVKKITTDNGIHIYPSQIVLEGLGKLKSAYLVDDKFTIGTSFKKLWSHMGYVCPFLRYLKGACCSPLFFYIDCDEYQINARGKEKAISMQPSYRKLEKNNLKCLAVQVMANIILKHPGEWKAIFTEEEAQKNALDNLYTLARNIKKVYPESECMCINQFLSTMKIYRSDIKKHPKSKKKDVMNKVNKLVQRLTKTALFHDLNNINHLQPKQ